MNVTLRDLFLIILLAVNIIMPVLYSIVVTILFIHGKQEFTQLNKDYKQLEELAEAKIGKMEKELKAKKTSKKETIGFSIKQDKATSEEQTEQEGSEKIA